MEESEMRTGTGAVPVVDGEFRVERLEQALAGLIAATMGNPDNIDVVNEPGELLSAAVLNRVWAGGVQPQDASNTVG